MAEATTHENAVAGIESMFLRREGVPQEQPKPRQPDGKFAKTTPEEPQFQEPAQAEEPGTEQVETPEGQEPAQAAPPQSEEVEVDFDFGGEKKTYRIPKEISDRFIQHADYTRKTQDVAEMRRALSAEREASNIERAFTQETAQERDHLALLDAQIAQFKHVNWAQLETQDLLRTRAQLDQLKESRADTQKAIEAKRAQFDQRIKAVTQEAISAGMKYIQQNIKGYDEKLQSQLHEYGRSKGFMQEELARIIDPRVIVVLHDAMQWANLQASQPGVTKRAASAAPVVRPGATQKTVSRVQQAAQAIKKATTPKGKHQAAEDYFAAKFGER